tara:strand:+ start:486 stop:1067 length:582 start_codon:yes stop_codon:yes gene_type:complete
MQAITPEERQGMLDVLSKFNAATSGQPVAGTAPTSTQTTSPTAPMAGKDPEMLRILENFTNATNDAVETVKAEVPIQVAENSVRIDGFSIEKVQGYVGNIKKKYYNVMQGTNILYENVCLYASASAIVKHLIDNDNNKANEVARLDNEYGGKLFEGASLSQKVKTNPNGIYEAKLTEVKMKATDIKRRILNSL